MTNEISGGEVDNAVQASNIYGGVHFDTIRQPFIESYQKAIDHLSSDRSHTRIAAVCVLGELGQKYPSKRQEIIEQLCEYLRLTPCEETTAEDRVRATAQKVIATHLRPARNEHGEATNPEFWPEIDLDLSGTRLTDADFSSCEIRNGNFDDTIFQGGSNFTGARFRGTASFKRTAFNLGSHCFEGAIFENNSWFESIYFNGAAIFNRATFNRNADFSDLTFNDLADFAGIEVRFSIHFSYCLFKSAASFDSVKADFASFVHIRFDRFVSFANAVVQQEPRWIKVVEMDPMAYRFEDDDF
ncbi:pentapeptide repeat-containing protein [Saccharopolyspora shandongensis]|uniref:pentapeptide repeat-containing protein n=1 Tax=Saccharopolyspora shandongensis TaxID=418495 RepID=UPI0033E8A4D4